MGVRQTAISASCSQGSINISYPKGRNDCLLKCRRNVERTLNLLLWEEEAATNQALKKIHALAERVPQV
jgi:hypothetical protein